MGLNMVRASYLRFLRPASVGILFALCCLLASLPARKVEAQGTGGTAFEWCIDSATHKPYGQWQVNDQDAHVGAIASITCTIYQTWDNYRQCQGGPLVFSSNTIGYGGSMPPGIGTITSGQKIFFNFSGTSSIWTLGLSPTGNWPSSTVSAGLPTGRYIVHVQVQHSDSQRDSADLVLFSSAGVFTTDQPGPPGNDPNIPANFDPGTDATTCAIRVNTYVQSGTAGLVATAGYRCLLTSGSNTWTATSDSSGTATFGGLPVKAYILSVAGSHIGTAGTTVYDNATSPIGVKLGATSYATVTFGNTGTGSIGANDPNTVNGAASGGGSGSASDNNNQQSWWAGVLSYIFVPQQSSIDTLKGDATQFTTWGPFGLFSQFLSVCSSANPVGMPIMSFPILGYHMPTSGSPAGSWLYTGSDQTIDPTAGMGSNPSYQFVRQMMGGGVWLTMVCFIVKMLIPKQMV